MWRAGAFRELYRDGERAKERPAHGVIYYELGQGEASQFHTLDADEYWFFHAGSTLDCGKSTTPANKIQAGAGRRR